MTSADRIALALAGVAVFVIMQTAGRANAMTDALTRAANTGNDAASIVRDIAAGLAPGG